MSSAFAVRFARTYLADPSASVLAPFLAEGVRVGTGNPPETESADVAQAEVSDVKDLGDGRAVLTVACELRDARTLYLAVPIVRSEAGEVAAGRLVRVLEHRVLPRIDVSLIHPAQRPMPARVRSLIDFLVTRFRDRAWQRRSLLTPTR